MTNSEKLTEAFVESLGIDAKDIVEELSYNSIPEWDSVAHMKLIAALERSFDIMFDTEDIIDMSSFRKAKEIVAKYRVEI